MIELARYGHKGFVTVDLKIFFKWRRNIGYIHVGLNSRHEAANWLWNLRRAIKWTKTNLYKNCYGDVAVPRVVKIGQIKRFSLRWMALRPIIITISQYSRTYDPRNHKLFGISPNPNKKYRKLLDLIY